MLSNDPGIYIIGLGKIRIKHFKLVYLSRVKHMDFGVKSIYRDVLFKKVN
mgnify:CR=1 FL=1